MVGKVLQGCAEPASADARSVRTWEACQGLDGELLLVGPGPQSCVDGVESVGAGYDDTGQAGREPATEGL